MKKTILIITNLLLCILALVACSNQTEEESVSFNTSSTITIYSRDTTSGTRDGFFSNIGFSDAVSNDSLLASSLVIVDSNGAMINSIQNDEYGIGYASLASVVENSSSVKALSYNGVEASIENVQNGTYELSRNFNYIVRQDSDMTENERVMVKAFLAFMGSQSGLLIIEGNDGILTTSISSAQTWDELKESNENVKAALAITEDVTINLGGSTSVEGIAEALTQAFSELVPHFKAVHNHTGSGDAYTNTQGSGKDSTSKLHIGFLSRELRLDSTEQATSGTYGFICKDGIVAIVNPNNTALSDVTADLLVSIFKGEVTAWNEV